jgi:uncharacterized protein (DUF58 family)
MTLPASRFLPPATLAGIQDLRLVARTVVEGYLSGLHADPRPSIGAEFHQYRAYEPGDDPRRVDWRAYARSDRFVVREAEAERDVTVRFLLDATASMAHGRPPLTKFDYARLLVAALAYLVDRQGDRLAFVALRDGAAAGMPPSRRGRALHHLLHLLERLQPSGRWPSWEALAGGMARARARELLVVVSDLHDVAGEVRAALAAMRALGHEVLVLHLLGRDEIDFPYEGDLIFEDLETGEAVAGDAAAMRAEYRRRLEREIEAWRLRLLPAGAAHELLPTDEPLDRALRSFLLRRLALP